MYFNNVQRFLSFFQIYKIRIALLEMIKIMINFFAVNIKKYNFKSTEKYLHL